jgi:hypothetical protein
VTWAVLHKEAIANAVPAVPVMVASSGAEALGKQPHLIIRSTALGDTFGKIALVPLDAPDGPRTMTTMQCDRVYMSASQGICLAGYRGDTAAYSAYIFDSSFQTRYTIPLNGLPSRARISPDGRYAAMTVFVSGHSYSDGNFSTQTSLIDLDTGTIISALEQFSVTRDGAQFASIDFNFWGVTFTRDSNLFYATLSTAGKTYLIQGDIKARQARVLYENVECPSLSPDNTQLAYKKAVVKDGQPMWQISVLDLASLSERPLAAETRSVDDQVEWLDNDHILYALQDDGQSPSVGENIWMLAADGTGQPKLFVYKGFSPAVVR